MTLKIIATLIVLACIIISGYLVITADRPDMATVLAYLLCFEILGGAFFVLNMWSHW